MQQRSELWGHPKGLYILFFTELWERFSYYGMRAILVLYIISSATSDNPALAGLGWTEENALVLYGWYTMLVYVMSIPGGIVADKWLGQKRTVLIGGLLLVAGHGILAVDEIWAFFTGLGLIILGVGGLKPNISTMVGGLYERGDERRDSGFTIFYIGINIGAFLSALIVGFVGETIGWHYGFGLAGIGMLLGQIVFMMGQKYLKGVGEKPTSVMQADDTNAGSNLFKDIFKFPAPRYATLAIIALGIYILFAGSIGYGLLTIAMSFAVGVIMTIYRDVNKVEKDRMIVLLISFIIVIVFWGAFEQAGGLMNIYTKQKIDREVSMLVLDFLFYGTTLLLGIRGLYGTMKKQQNQLLFYILAVITGLGYTALRMFYLTDPFVIPASVFQSVNAIFIVIFGTIVAGFWLWWKHRGKESSSLFKMAIGTIIMGTGFIMMAMATQEANDFVGAKGLLIWLILAYFLHTIGELSASPVALSFITKLAPVKYVSIMMGFYFAATGLGNKLAGVIGESAQAEPVRIELAATDASIPGIADSVTDNERNFELVAKIDVQNGQVVFTKDDQNINEFFTLDAQDKQMLKGRIEDADEDTLTAVMQFEKDQNDLSKPYSAEVQIFELQNEREFRTFIFIFIFTAAFGILLIIFLKKLKKLTHGAEEKEGTSHEEQENYELGDLRDEEKDRHDPGRQKKDE